MLIRTSVLIEIRNAVWAYKYNSLRPSRVDFDPRKSIDELRADLQPVVQEREEWSVGFASDFSPFKSDTLMASELPPGYGTAMMACLKKKRNGHFYTCAVTPYHCPMSLHHRHGRLPVDTVSLTNPNSGIHSAIQDNQVLTFTVLMVSLPFRYATPRSSILGKRVGRR
jgi:hypothetical protein